MSTLNIRSRTWYDIPRIPHIAIYLEIMDHDKAFELRDRITCGSALHLMVFSILEYSTPILNELGVRYSGNTY